MILFTADWHIKLGAKGVPVSWAINRYKMFFEQVHAIEGSVDLHIIGGDIFDKMPSMEELSIFFNFVKGVTIDTYIFAGNHEATKKGKTFLSLLKDVVNSINSKVHIIDEILETDDYIIVPYEYIHLKSTWENLTKKPVFTHVRGEIPPHVKPEIDLDWLEKFPVVYLGDLHSHSNCQRNMVYPGSPMTTSFHRSRVSTGYLLIDSNDLTKWEWKEFELPQLIRKTVTDKKEMVSTTYDHTIYEIEGSISDLGQLENSELLDKKIVKRSTDVALVLNEDMALEEELVEYLAYIMLLEDDALKEVMSTYYDYAGKT